MEILGLRIEEGDHLCAFHEEAREQFANAFSFLGDGVAQGQFCLLVVEAAALSEARRLIHETRPLLASALQEGQLAIEAAESVYLEAGLVTSELFLDAWRRALERARRGGFNSLRLASDMSWMATHPFWFPQLIEYEAKTNLSGDLRRVTALCQYSRRRFPEDVLLDILRAHPLALIDRQVRPNPYFLPANVLLQRDKRGKFAWYLDNLARNLPVRRFDQLAAAGTEATSRDRVTPLLDLGSIGTHPLSRPIGSPDEALKFLGRDAPKEWSASHRYRVVYGALRWQIYCFGELRVLRGDGQAIDWSAGRGAALKAKTLFVYLLHRGDGGARAEELADLLWPEQGDVQKAMGRLYHTIHCLRLALEPDPRAGGRSRFIIAEGSRYFLALPEGSWLDVTLYEHFCYRGMKFSESGALDDALACYLAAESLYTGDFLADIPSRYADDVDGNWCWSRRYWLREMYIKLMLSLAGIYLQRGAVGEAAGYWQRALDLDPLREEAHEGLLRTFHRAGRRDALIRHFGLYEKQLAAQEMGPPSPSLLATYRELLASLRAEAGQSGTPRPKTG